MVQDIHDYTWRSRGDWPVGAVIRIHVEGNDDAGFYTRMAGPTLSRYIEFRPGAGPNGTRGGYHTWQAMKADRAAHGGGGMPNGVNQAYCLLDGEEASHAGIRDIYARCRHLIHEPDEQEFDYDLIRWRTIDNLDGVLFLGCYELENLYALHSGLLRTMIEQWGKTRAIFGENTTVDKAYVVLQRALILAELSEFAKQYSIEHGEFSREIGDLKSVSTPTKPHLDRVIEALRHPPQGKTPINRRVPDDVLSAGISNLRSRIEIILNGSEAIKCFHPELLTRCDGRALRNLAIDKPETWSEHYRSDFIANGFATYFQMSLVDAILRRRPWQPTYRTAYAEPPYFDMTPRGTAGTGDQAPPGYEASYGQGRLKLTARRRSWQLVPPRLFTKNGDGR